MDKPAVLFCRCDHSGVVPEDLKHSVYELLLESGIAFEVVSDLCELAAQRSPFLEEFSQRGNLKIAACFPRTVKWLFHVAGTELPNSAEILNMREEGAERIIEALSACPRGAPVRDRDRKGSWMPWFPVIDYDRCQGCQQCKDFCLFHVFEVRENDEVRVKNPANCKTLCPACARICPEAAIIFPKYETAPFNGSLERPPEGEQVQVDLKELLKGDIYQTLRKRGTAKVYKNARELAEEERKACACTPTNLSKFLEKVGIKPDGSNASKEESGGGAKSISSFGSDSPQKSDSYQKSEGTAKAGGESSASSCGCDNIPRKSKNTDNTEGCGCEGEC